MRNLTQQKCHVSFGALLREAKNKDLIQIGKFTFIFQDGSLLQAQGEEK
jgi:hypothetical protein